MKTLETTKVTDRKISWVELYTSPRWLRCRQKRPLPVRQRANLPGRMGVGNWPGINKKTSREQPLLIAILPRRKRHDTINEYHRESIRRQSG
jgi:hypothetical protein